MISQIFACVDNQDPVKFVEYLTDDCSFRFGNQPVVVGRESIQEYVKQFFASIKGLSHDILTEWEILGGAACHGFVTYTRHDDSTVTIPFANIFKIKSAKVQEYLIFADTSELYNT